MGIADLIPGISGGTIAFIMGFYETLLQSLRSVQKKESLLFLFPLAGGMGTSILLLSGMIHFLLEENDYRDYLYSSFLGLIFASFYFCIKKVEKWDAKAILLCFFGLVTAFLFSTSSLGKVSYTQQHTLILDPWLIFCGIIAVCAMLLPGISGSYMLTIFGVYPLIIRSLVQFRKIFSEGIFDAEAFFILLSLGIGVLIGFFSFSHAVSWLLDKYRNSTIAMLCGFIFGACPSVFPYWNKMHSAFSISNISISDVYISSLFFLGGIIVVFFIEKLQSIKMARIVHFNKF